MAETPTNEPSDEQKLVLNVIWQSFQKEGSWPSYAGVDQVVDREGLNIRPLVETMPQGLMIPDARSISWQWFPQPGDELRVQIRGLAYCDDTERDLALLARVVRYLADRERTFVIPKLSNAEPLLIRSDEVKRDLELSDEEGRRAYELLHTFEWRVMNGGSGGPDEWGYQIDVEAVRAYRHVETTEDYLAVRLKFDRQQPPAIVAPLPTEPEFEALLAPVTSPTPEVRRSLWAQAISPLLRHPVVATIVGGLILAGVLYAIRSL